MNTDALLDRLRAASPAMLADLATLVGIETPSADLTALAEGVAEVAALGERLTGKAPKRIAIEDREHLRWSWGGPTRVLLLGHLDTVWPKGTLSRWPFAVVDGRATGPGCFDMKAGLVQLFHALAEIDNRDGVTVLVTTDEELGSPTSRALIEETAAGARAALVLEASAAGALKTGRKGVAHYRVQVTGRAAHAGLAPELGANATVQAAHLVLELDALARPEADTTVTPTVLHAGSSANTVPATAELQVDSRACSSAEQRRVDAAMRTLAPTVPGTTLTVHGGINRPPLEPEHTRALFDTASRLAKRLGLAPLESAEVGGASDGNFTAGIGVPTLDGLGAVGDGAHAEGEWVAIAALPQRAALLAALIDELLDQG